MGHLLKSLFLGGDGDMITKGLTSQNEPLVAETGHGTLTVPCGRFAGHGHAPLCTVMHSWQRTSDGRTPGKLLI